VSLGGRLAALLLASLATLTHAQAPSPSAAASAAQRPRIGLVLARAGCRTSAC
jgi:hypothetical protein